MDAASLHPLDGAEIEARLQVRLQRIRQRAYEIVAGALALCTDDSAAPPSLASALRQLLSSSALDADSANGIAQYVLDLFITLRLAALRLADRHQNVTLGDIMTTDLALLYRQEARRQAVVATQIVEGMLGMPETYIPEKRADHGIDREGLREILALLATEMAKLDANEATIAVLGAMKAGKSTTINAIVGSEVLPSREQPMTTFPTIVTHAPGMLEPTMDFPLAAAFAELAGNVRTRISELGDGLENAISTATAVDSLRRLATKVRDGHLSIPHSATGLAAVRQLLEEVNDLTRLARQLNVSDECVGRALQYESLPRIRIEFEHLIVEPGVFSGTLSLVDTPGPDEAGSSAALETIAKKQLADASAIVLIMNFTTIGNEGDARVKDLLKWLPPGASDRLFVFVNKYDAAQEYGDHSSEEERSNERERRIDDLRQLIARQIESVINENAAEKLCGRCFPTAAHRALLANQARRAIRIEGKLSPSLAWVRNFANTFLGVSWERRPEMLADSGRVLEAATDGWVASRFDEPLARAISYSAQNASRLLVMACLDKMREGMSRVYERLNIGRSALDVDTERVLTAIRELSEDLAAIGVIRTQNEVMLLKAGETLHPALTEYTSGVRQSIKVVVEEYKKLGDPDSMKKKHQEQEQARRAMLVRILERLKQEIPHSEYSSQAALEMDDAVAPLIEKLRHMSVVSHPQSGAKCIRLRSAEDALQQATSIYAVFDGLLKHGAMDIGRAVDSAVNQVVADTKHAVVVSFQERWQRVENRIVELLAVPLDKPEIAVSISPTFNEDDAGEIITSHNIMEEKEGIGSFVARRGGWLLDKLGFDTRDWGRHEVEYHYIDLDEIRDSLFEKLGEVSKETRSLVDDAFKSLRKSCVSYARELADQVEQIQRYLEEERIAREADVDAYARLRDEIMSLADQADDLRREAETLRGGVVA